MTLFDTGSQGMGDDRLDGATAIAAFIGMPIKRVFSLAERRLIPVGKEGGRLVASKRVLTEHYAKLTSGG